MYLNIYKIKYNNWKYSYLNILKLIIIYSNFNANFAVMSIISKEYGNALDVLEFFMSVGKLYNLVLKHLDVINVKQFTRKIMVIVKYANLAH